MVSFCPILSQLSPNFDSSPTLIAANPAAASIGFELKVVCSSEGPNLFLIFGDIFGKVFGMGFGRHMILNKTVEGTLAYLGSMFLCGYVMYTILDISLIVLILGGLAAPITELFSIKMNDNFTVSIISGTVMLAASLAGL